MGRIKKTPVEVSASRAAAAHARWSEGRKFVYFAAVGPFIKIGCSTNPRARIRAILSQSSLLPPGDLRAYGEPGCVAIVGGGLKTEARLHARFAHLRVAGTREWYHAKEEILDFAASMTSGARRK